MIGSLSRRAAAWLAGLVSIALVSGCSALTPEEPPATPTSSRPSPSNAPTRTQTPPQASSPTPSADPIEACVEERLDDLGSSGQIGQLFMIGATNSSPTTVALLKKHRIGSVIVMGGTSGVAQTKRLVTTLGRSAGAVPMLFAADQEGGLVQRLKGAGFSGIPGARTQATWSDAKLRSAWKAWGTQLRAAGVRMTLAPVADVVPSGFEQANAPIGRLRRGYGSDPEVVSTKVAAVIAGLNEAGVASSVKHFPGIGRVRGNTDFSTTVVDTVTGPKDTTLAPFFDAADAGVPAVMLSTVTYRKIDPKQRAVFSKTVIGLLRSRGYDNVVISDDLGAAASLRTTPVRDRAVKFIAAGGDLAINVSPSLTAAMVAGVKARSAKDDAFKATVREAAGRVLRLKVTAGLIRCG